MSFTSSEWVSSLAEVWALLIKALLLLWTWCLNREPSAFCGFIGRHLTFPLWKRLFNLWPCTSCCILLQPLCDYKYWVGEKGSGFTLMNTLPIDMVCLTSVYAAVDMLLQSSDWADTMSLFQNLVSCDIGSHLHPSTVMDDHRWIIWNALHGRQLP